MTYNVFGGTFKLTHSTNQLSALEVFYDNALYKSTFYFLTLSCGESVVN